MRARVAGCVWRRAGVCACVRARARAHVEVIAGGAGGSAKQRTEHTPCREWRRCSWSLSTPRPASAQGKLKAQPAPITVHGSRVRCGTAPTLPDALQRRRPTPCPAEYNVYTACSANGVPKPGQPTCRKKLSASSISRSNIALHPFATYVSDSSSYDSPFDPIRVACERTSGVSARMHTGARERALGRACHATCDA